MANTTSSTPPYVAMVNDLGLEEADDALGQHSVVAVSRILTGGSMAAAVSH